MFDLSPRVQDLKAKLQGFMDEHIYPNEAVFYEQVKQNKWGHPAILEELKEKAKGMKKKKKQKGWWPPPWWDE